MRSQLCQIEAFTRNMGCEEEEVFEEAGGADALDAAVEDLAPAAQLLHPSLS